MRGAEIIEQRQFDHRAPINRAILADPVSTQALIESFLAIVFRDIVLASDGRACTVDRVYFTTINDETTWMQPGHGIGQLQVTVTFNAPMANWHVSE